MLKPGQQLTVHQQAARPDRQGEDELLTSCVAACLAASHTIVQAAEARDTLVWEEKSPADFVTVVDRKAEDAVRDELLQRHRDAALVGEEGGGTLPPTGLCFVVDPLDGTTNFLRGLPWYAVSIGALVDGVARAGAVLNVANGELYEATAGGGAFLNRSPIRVSCVTNSGRSVIGTGFPSRRDDVIARYLPPLRRIMRETAGLRRAGSATLDLCAVASGRLDAFWELSLGPWDVAAAGLIVREAGGVITDLQGRPIVASGGAVVAGNPTMHRWLLEVLDA